MTSGKAVYWLAGLLAILPAGAAVADGPGQTAQTAENMAVIAIHNNNQVLAAKAQYESALHQISQAYVPQDPVLTFTNNQSLTGLSGPLSDSIGVTQNFQFPGKALLQGDQAHRNAGIAELVYFAAARDVRAQTKAIFYQALLDENLANAAAENSHNLWQMLIEARVALLAHNVTASDVMSAEFDLAQATQAVVQSQVAEANDEADLNALLGQAPDSPLRLDPALALEPLALSLDEVTARALALRQEILEAALSEQNSATALKLAKMEVLPDFSVSLTHNHYPVDWAAPPDGRRSDWNASFSISVPVFGWFKQREDATAAADLLEAARKNRRSADLSTATQVLKLWRLTDQAFKTAELNRALVGKAQENFQKGLLSYQKPKDDPDHIDFSTLSGILQRLYSARINYLIAANQFLAGKIALEQTIGVPTPL